MALFQIDHIQIDGIAACVPKEIIRTADYTYITEQEQKVFEFGTGIKERRAAPESVCTSDMCYSAALQLIEDTNTKIDEIDVLIFVSQSPDYFLPATSIILQEKLGCSKTTMAFDVNLGCSGYVYGLSILSNLMQLPGLRKGLLLCGDKSTFSTAYTDKSTYPLFGDAGTATIISKSLKPNPIFFNLQSDGSGKESIIIRSGAVRNRITEDSLKTKVIEHGIERNDLNLELNGIEVFNFALREVKPNVIDLLNFANFKIEDLDYLVMHQANKLMNESVRKKLKVPIEKVPYSIQKFGNTSSASVPLTLVSELIESCSEQDKIVLLSAFGVGYSWGSILINMKHTKLSKLIEI